MTSTPDTVHEGIRRAVGHAVQRAGDTDRFTLAGGLRADLVAHTGLPLCPSLREVLQRHGPVLADLVVRYAEPDTGSRPDAAGREAAAHALHTAMAALARDLAATGLVTPPATTPREPGPYASPSVHRAVHDVPHVVTPAGRPAPAPRPTGDDTTTPDRSPGAAARRRALRTQHALEQARRTVRDTDWAAAEEAGRQALARLRPHQRLAVLWVDDPGRLVVGRANPAHGALHALAGIPGAGVFAGSLQCGARSGPLRRTRTALVSGLPDEAGERVAAALAAHGFRTAVAPASRWESSSRQEPSS
ncbi:hypothetical protein [Streptomyces sp. NPDC015131]|uniref:hypothetical protein n=1 Tax=Streptomyces sp. NPDC015131 TaxID=3364941 RepID=UPI0036F8AEFB